MNGDYFNPQAQGLDLINAINLTSYNYPHPAYVGPPPGQARHTGLGHQYITP